MDGEILRWMFIDSYNDYFMIIASKAKYEDYVPYIYITLGLRNDLVIDS